jgi:hypothetical protein
VCACTIRSSNYAPSRERQGNSLPSPTTRRRLYRLWRELDARIEEALRQRFQQFRKGSISSDEFEKPTSEERKLERLSRLIVKIERKTKPKSRYAKRAIRSRVYYSIVQAA